MAVGVNSAPLTAGCDSLYGKGRANALENAVAIYDLRFTI